MHKPPGQQSIKLNEQHNIIYNWLHPTCLSLGSAVLDQLKVKCARTCPSSTVYCYHGNTNVQDVLCSTLLMPGQESHRRILLTQLFDVTYKGNWIRPPFYSQKERVQNLSQLLMVLTIPHCVKDLCLCTVSSYQLTAKRSPLLVCCYRNCSTVYSPARK